MDTPWHTISFFQNLTKKPLRCFTVWFGYIRCAVRFLVQATFPGVQLPPQASNLDGTVYWWPLSVVGVVNVQLVKGIGTDFFSLSEACMIFIETCFSKPLPIRFNMIFIISLDMFWLVWKTHGPVTVWWFGRHCRRHVDSGGDFYFQGMNAISFNSLNKTCSIQVLRCCIHI